MSLLDFSSICRTCLSPNFVTKSVFNLEVILDQEISLQEMLMTCTSITVIKGDRLPSNICVKCIEELRTAFSFKKLCEKSNIALNRYLNSNGSVLEEPPNQKIIKVEASPEEHQNDEVYQIEQVNLPVATGNFYCPENNVKPDSTSTKCSRKYNCDICSEDCFGLASYNKHLSKIHGKKKLKRGKVTSVEERPFQCKICNMGFAQMSHFRVHTLSHEREKPHKCLMCEKRFTSSETLHLHIRTHTGERPHVCKICGKGFSLLGRFRTHIETHTRESRVQCRVCNRRFTQSSHLLNHMRTHSGEKPYSCKDCGRSFAVKDTLKRHIRTHTGERPYVCSACGQAFAQSATLTKHMKVHIPKT